MILLAVDPSLRSTGAALFVHGQLVAVERFRGLTPNIDVAHRARDMARDIRDWVGSAQPTLLAVEWPQIYRETKSKGDHNDLLGLAGVCAALAAMYPDAIVKSYRPAEWEPAPKVSPTRKAKRLGPIDSEAFTSPRGVRVMGRLLPAERELVPMSHDAVDAVGIGLHALGRLGRARIYPGAE